MTTRILLAYDHEVVRKALRALLEADAALTVVAEASDGREAVAEAERSKPDVVVLDGAMPKLPTVDVIGRILQFDGSARILILSLGGAPSRVDEVFRAGARGFLARDASPSELFLAIRTLMAGQHYVSPSAASDLVSALGHGGVRGEGRLRALTSREREILQLIAEGLSSKEIAAQLGVSTRTVDSHRAHMKDKLRVHNVGELVRMAIREGIVSP